jgi:hypothetical protein
MMVRNILLFTFILALLSACSSNPTNQVATPTGVTSTTGVSSTQAYPGPASAAPTSAYPGPVGNSNLQPTPLPTPTTDAQAGIVKGIILVAGQPPDSILYLAPVIKDNNGREVAAGVNTAKAPVAVPDANGNFTFHNVPPGHYAVIYNDSASMIALANPKTNAALTVTIAAGQTVDLGKLEYTSLSTN